MHLSSAKLRFVLVSLVATGALLACATAIDNPPIRPPGSDAGSAGESGAAAGASGGTGAVGGTLGGESGGGGTGNMVPMGGASGSPGGSGASGASGLSGAGSGGVSGAGVSGAGVSGAGVSGAAGAGMGGGGMGGAPGSVLFSEDFESGTATGWLNTGGTWSVVQDDTSVYRQDTLTGTSALVVASAGATWADQAIEARVKILQFGGTSSSDQAAIYGRFQDSNNHYYLSLQGDGSLKIKQKFNNNNTSLTSSVRANITTGVWYTVKLEIVGTTLRAYLNGVLQTQIVDTAIASGGMAIGGINTTAEFDDIKVTVP